MASEQEVRAWTFTGGYPDTLKLSKIKVPQESEVDEQHVLVRISACALNPVDIQIMNMPTFTAPWGDKSPKTTVMDFSGTVVACPGGQFSQGDEIFGMAFKSYLPAGGALAEMACLDLRGTPAVKKPEGWSAEKAAAISLVWLTAKACIENVAPWVEKTQGKRVAVLGGSSSTGIYSILLAKRRGWKVVATSSGRNKDFVLEDLNTDAHVDYTQEEVRRAVGKFEPDAVIDCVGGTECIGLPSSKRYISIVGDKTGRTMMGGPYTYYDYLHPLTAASQWLRWAWGRVGLGEAYDVVILSPKNEWLEEAKGTLGQEQIFVDAVFGFEDAKDAFERLNSGRARGKVVVRVAR
ncbi:hypothetical protein M409DRAFT_51307 [Zasmidium cellare ATCC 36951]|uniref:Enoyl reductase (ER) domain-containing protein n=1 Tax=Zasmidium cellare ATCC 36951 TaxID=1080233 RepID=A0A6A6D0B8_ZASCE|nr:uncharacterized protein M409DRAFT_51307 [Zasmidium cellare ATCC 36951]KAF2171086.1 hypothetical protein M409DRAFT_51307 [Zasmidium cellare ATCC 36951]